MRRIQEIQKRWSTDQLITGIELSRWAEVLRDNGFQVSPSYLHRAAWVTAFSVPSTLLGRLEDARFGRRLAAMDIDPQPVFVLGHWRSGTTHLHNLLGRAPGHTYPTVYQVVFPTAFLSTGGVVPEVTGRLLDETRSYDNVRQGWGEAAEDEIALAKLTGISPYLAFMFPDHAPRYERYVDLLEATHDERERWKEGLRYFVKKVMLQAGGLRAVIKSCPHTARIRLLLEMFPDARFVFIHRHPYRVYASTLHMRGHTDWENFFHLPGRGWDAERERQTLALGRRITERYLEDRHLIPEGNLVELSYEELCADELGVMGRLWDRLRLGGWEQARPALSAYLGGIGEYARNRLDITDAQKAAVRREWGAMFDAFEYRDEETP